VKILFIAVALTVFSGGKMVFAGIKNEQAAKDLWAYLKQFDAQGNVKK